MTEYTVSEMAEICGINKSAVAWRLNKLGLKAPHDDEHLKAVQNYLVKNKPLTLYQIAKQRYGDAVESYYQGYSYRWRVLGKPDITSLAELDKLWSDRIEERKKHAEEYKEYTRHVSTSASLIKKDKKLRHMYDWYTFDSNGTWDEEVKYWYDWYTESGYKSCAARRLAYLEVLRQHHVLDQEEYCEFKESGTKLKMAFQ